MTFFLIGTALFSQRIITHILCYMMLENGIFLLSLSVAGEMPMLVNAGVLLDLFVGIYLFVIFFNKIQSMCVGSRSIDSLFFKDLYQRAGEINPFWLKIAFAFIFVGFGTKIGIAPIHAWLPDAHSEAPSPVSALLSGTLLNTAFLGLLRVYEIFIRAHSESFPNFLLLLTGFLSLMVSSVFMLRIKNYKRMLAYSSIENMGILFIGMSLGKLGIFAESDVLNRKFFGEVKVDLYVPGCPPHPLTFIHAVLDFLGKR